MLQQRGSYLVATDAGIVSPTPCASSAAVDRFARGSDIVTIDYTTIQFSCACVFSPFCCLSFTSMYFYRIKDQLIGCDKQIIDCDYIWWMKL